MRKYLAYVLIMMLLVLTACGNEKNTNTETEAANDETNNSVEEKEEKTELVVYIPDDMYENTKQIIVECEDITEELILQVLKENGVLSESSGINFVKQEGTSLHVDVNTGFGEHLRSMGTAGESMILECLVNTFLDAYECEQMMITENEEILCSGHAEYTDYFVKYE